MTTVSYAPALAKIVSGIQKDLLKNYGFKRSGNGFNRMTPEGLTQVISFQAGSYAPFAIDIPAMNHYPNALHGQFTINLGVFVPEVAKLLDQKSKEFVRDYDCEMILRSRLGQETRGEEMWLSLSEDPEKTLAELSPLIEHDCFPFFQKLGSREQIIHFLEETPKHSNVRIVLAMMLLEKGKKKAAEALLKEQYKMTENEFHREYVAELATKLDMAIS